MKKPIGFEIKLEPGSKIVTIPIADDLKEYLQSLSRGKSHIDYLKEFLGSEHNYNVAEKAVTEAMHKSLPEDAVANCQFCNGDSKDESDKACTVYKMQMEFTFMIAAQEFIRIVLSNKLIYDHKAALQNLTINFYDSLEFIAGKGLMFLNLEKLCRFALSANFQAISKNFAESEILQNLQIINETLNVLDDEDIQNQVLQQEDENYLDLQKRFFENKQRYYKEKLSQQEATKGKHKSRQRNAMSIPQHALYYYYLQAAGEFPYFENHPDGKLKAIEELVEIEQIPTTPKHFQMKYNFINNHQSNRIAKNQVANISYVIDKLSNNLKAKEIAVSELKQAQTKTK
ncbi:hypothetical protein FLLO111716_10840 [Flavobacterium longum]|uniref:hypothetical protein n=1 Tax=Flavobacterium longum TaxID=1299340 RepID=UPI0039EB985E